jgi:hypothetical protein
MPGRFMVFMPTVDHMASAQDRIARRARAAARHRPRVREANGFTGGVIIRTRRAAGRRGHPRRPRGLPQDLTEMRQATSRLARRPSCSRQSIVARLLRDLLTEDSRRSGRQRPEMPNACWS